MGKLRVAFRVDASLKMGSGHVMRCLTLAGALKKRGAEICFICREHLGNLIQHISSKGYVVHKLPRGSDWNLRESEESLGNYSDWLGATCVQDAEDCAAILDNKSYEWLIVDHYALDVDWESRLRPYCRRLMVIDDLANRMHLCNLLLDQTFCRAQGDYASLVPANCALLCGSEFALLRPEFSQIREFSLKRRANPQLKRVLITMGGMDSTNVTERVLLALERSDLPDDCIITVIMGESAPWLSNIQILAERLPWKINVLKNVQDMASIMAESDFAIGAAGSTSWERCCLGLPTAMVVTANNQKTAAESLAKANAVIMLDLGDTLDASVNNTIRNFVHNPTIMSGISRNASNVTDGNGCERVVRMMGA